MNICVIKVREKKQMAGFDLGKKDVADLRYIKGKVILVGNDIPKNEDGEQVLKEGDIIYFDKTRANTLIEDGEMYTFTDYRSVVSVL